MKTQRLSLIVGLLTCFPLVSSAAQNVQARFEKSLKDARSLTNVEIQMLETSIYPPSPKETDYSSTVHYTYIASGPKFRATCTLISATQTNSIKRFEAAFNGTLFITYNADTRMMTRGEKIAGSSSSELSASPLIAPFLFLTKNSDNCPTCLLRFTDVASPDFARELILPKGQPSNGMLHISMPGPPLAQRPTSWKIDIDAAGDSFTPNAVTLTIEAGGILKYTLLNYTNLGGYQFPARIECVHTLYPPTSPRRVKSTIITTVTSVRIPDQIADSVFELGEEENSAKTIWDSDHKKIVKSPYDRLKAELRTQPNIYDESAEGSKQIADALIQARKEHKQVLLQFGANWCGWCHKLHKLFETNKDIAKELEEGYVVVLIDVNGEHNKDVDTKYGQPTRFGLPSIVVLDADGQQLTAQDTGKLEEGDHHSPDKVMAFLKKCGPKKQP